jgi:hypothetical protein
MARRISSACALEIRPRRSACQTALVTSYTIKVGAFSLARPAACWRSTA